MEKQWVPERVLSIRRTRERGRLARMHCRCVPLSFPAMGRNVPYSARGYEKPHGWR